MNDLKITQLGLVDGVETEVHAFIATWTLKPETIAEAKLRGAPEQIDLETKVTVRFHILGSRLRNMSRSQIDHEAEKQARRLARIAIDGREDSNVVMT